MDGFAPQSESSPTATAIARKVAVRTQRRRWQRSTDRWEDHAVAGLESVIDAVLVEADDRATGIVVDVGTGGGALAVPLAERAQQVIALDVSTRMLERLSRRCDQADRGD
jgi:ubiquinone/menaquinone biosynthesis C-methylase UbiE